MTMTTVAVAGDGGVAPSLRASSSVSKDKGKAKMDADTEAEEVWTCGICLAKSREAIPGELDCCAHHFCFVCIMAWARVESRCPFCKARFHSIRRPPVPGRFPSERIVTVPERNQVYCPEGNTNSTMDADAYANIICSVCNCCRNDELLMLCDLCDVPAHTYCVGLGTIVPEGDWFCDDCAASKEVHSRCQADDEFDISVDVQTGEAAASTSPFGIVDEDRGTGLGNRRRVQSGRISMADPVPSIYDIVGDDYTTNAGTIRLRSNSEDFPSQGTPPARSLGRDNSLALYHALIRMGIERTRALRESRNRDKRIRALRENWALLHDGSMEFRTHVPSRRAQGEIEAVSAVTEHQHFVPPTVVCRKNDDSDSSDRRSFALFSEETSTSLGHGNKTSHKDTRDVRKAWKMLELAKTSGEKKISNRHSSLSNCTAPFSMGNRSTSYSPIDTIVGSRNQNLNMVAQKNNANCDHGAKMESGPSIKYSEQFRSLPESIRELIHERLISFHGQLNKETSGDVAASTYRHHGHQTLESGSQSTVMVRPGDSSAVCVATTGEIRRSASIEVGKSSGQDRHEHKRKLSSEKCHDQTSKRSRSSRQIAKFEISDLVIRELKLLKIDRAYGSDKFKEVARTATHTMLAACGFEHFSSQSLALSRPVCEHSSGDQLLNSSVIANFCAECLHGFVKEAVNLVLSCRQMDKTVGTF